MTSQRWNKEQLKLAFHLYCQLPFGRLHGRNPEIIELSELIERTPDAVAMKLVNFASLDPAITGSGRKGLGNASALDREVWSEFNHDWEALVMECVRLKERILTDRGLKPLIKPESTVELDLPEDFTGETRRVVVEQRVKQSFFRRAVLGSYGGRCCMSGLSERKLLVASHIVPWNKDKSNRLNPRNGLCLSAIHDRAFDQGLITVTPDFDIKTSPTLEKHRTNVLAESLLALSGRSIGLPERFLPSREFLLFHSTAVFIAAP